VKTATVLVHSSHGSTPLAAPMEIAPGSELGSYRALVAIGEGGMAQVWVARIIHGPREGRLAAIKMIRPELVQNVEFQQMFDDEARIASRVRHENVCETFELVEDGDLRFLAMEWIDGVSLYRLLHGPKDRFSSDTTRVRMNPRIAARIVANASAGLHASHELLGDDGELLRVVHRDVSPHNILVTQSGQVKVTDFGVAKALGKTHRTLAGHLKGKLSYMSPEQLLDGANIDRRSDVFGLGCLLHEATTGRQTFGGRTDPEIMRAVLLNVYDPPRSVIPSLPVELEDIIVRALSKDREDRFQTAEQMQRALESFIKRSGPPVTASHVATLVRQRCGVDVDAVTVQIAEAEGSPLSRLDG
jgi:eukaryotic-like serine/threonine-protein kinase